MVADFSGYATKAGLKCSDGRTITPEAFKDMDGKTVPLVWQHGHNDPNNVLGHAILEARADGVYAYGYFNGTDSGKNAKALVQHKDIVALSIYANQLVEKSKSVLHGVIRELSLVLSGANPGAFIDNVAISHSDGDEEVLEDEAVIYTGLTLEHEDKPAQKKVEEKKDDPTVEHADGSDQTVQDVYDSMTPEQQNVVAFMIGAALDSAGDASQSDNNNGGDLNHQEGTDMTRNVFEKNGDGSKKTESVTLSHEDVKGIVADAIKGGSLKAAVEGYALEHGIDNIDVLFPDAKAVNGAVPEFDTRRSEWVPGVLSGTKHSPFSRIKSLSADLRFEEARAKGYIKGTLKKEEFFGVSKRVTTPSTIYKKQKLDRDDMIDITDFDVVAWLKGEMRLMLDEEIARAVLIGDGRDVEDDDKINEGNIRPIATDDDLYTAKVYVNIGDANSSAAEIVDAILVNRALYKGTGQPTFYTTEPTLTSMLLLKDTLGRRLYRNVSELADELRVAAIVPVEPMEEVEDLLGVLVNLADYTIGADRGGDVSMFDDFDIDYNQYKYLIETRISGALTKIRSAIAVLKTDSGDVRLTDATAPTFVSSTGVVTIVATSHVVYKDADTGATLSTGAQTALDPGESMNVVATAASGYYFDSSEEFTWHFTRDRA